MDTPTFLLIRTSAQDADRTLGKIYFDGAYLSTLELPWKGNQKRVSCIPEGRYVCKETLNRKTLGGLSIPRTFEITNVHHREGILFHIGNWPKDTNGCVLIGNGIGTLGNELALLDSRKGFDHFLRITKDLNTFYLEVRWSKYF